MRKRYTIEFERSRRMWLVIDNDAPDFLDGELLGYHHEKATAMKVAGMLNERIELLKGGV